MGVERGNSLERQRDAELYDPMGEPWEAIRDTIIRIESEQFGDGAFDEETLKNYFTDSNSTTVFLREEGTRHIIGFTNAVPTNGLYDDEFHPERAFDPHTAYIMDTAIDRAYTGRHLVGKLMTVLEEELRRKGYTHIERDAATANRYAANIEKIYGERILFSKPHDSEWGPQVFFRIKL